MKKPDTATPSRRETPRGFVSYAHENAEHKENVRTLATILRENGMEIFLDRWHKAPRIDWNQTITNWIREADFVLAVASPSYRCAADGNSPDGVNLDVQHELVIIRELLNSDRVTWLPKIIPVILPGWSLDDVPTVLQPTTANHCVVPEITEEGSKELVGLLTAGSEHRRNRPPGRHRPSPISEIGRRFGAVATRQRTVVVSLAVAASAAVGVVALGEFGGISQNTTISGTGNSLDQNFESCAQLVDSSCVVQIEQEAGHAGESAETDDELKEKLKKDAIDDPRDFGTGPWPFMVVDTMVGELDYGLFARSSNRLEGNRLGTAPNRSLVWADCVAESDFTPMGESIANVGPQWLHIHWAPVEPMANSVSDPAETRHAWMYRGGVVPVKHDGDIPKCR